MLPYRNRPFVFFALPFLAFQFLCCLTLQAGECDRGDDGAAKRPNILIAISDDQSWIHTSASGCSTISTPNFDRVAREGVRFNNAICASPGCSPSRASILTGRYPWQLEQAGTHASSFPKKYLVYPEVLEKAGYFVGYTGKGWQPGNFKTSGRNRNPAGVAFSKLKVQQVPASGISKNNYAGNFNAFLEEKPTDQPFCFWYGATEPHRGFEKGSGVASGKRLTDVKIPGFLPDSEEIRSDILDYCLEIEWFDRHLGKMIKTLEARGELDSTLIIVTSDNGMAFPRAKANVYEYGIHMPLAIRFPSVVPGDRVVDDVVSLTDLAPTILQIANVEHPLAKGELNSMTGESLVPMLQSDESGKTSFSRGAAYSCRERHSSSRWDNLTYPQRCIRTSRYLLIRNMKPERWPAGAPRKLQSGKLGPEDGGYHDIDACPSLSFMIAEKLNPKVSPYFSLAVAHRPALELYDIQQDPACLNNLSDDSEHQKVKVELEKKLNQYLKTTGDPRLNGNGDVWEKYIRYSRLRSFPRPGWAK